jgi:rhodanese-related sulfurtransferase
MRIQPHWVIFTLSLALIAAACSPQATSATVAPSAASEQAEAEYRTLTIDEFADIVANQNDSFSIINVHIPYEGEVAGTDAHVPYNDLDALTSALPDKNAPIILYCRSGRMSEIASQALIERGYTQVWDVPGGMNAWQESDREIKMNAG